MKGALMSLLRIKLYGFMQCCAKLSHALMRFATFPTASEFPLPYPFGPSPTDDEVKWQRHENNSKRHIAPSECKACDVSILTATLVLTAAELHHQQSSDKLSPPALLFRPLLLTDCCFLYSSIRRIQPRSTDNCAKLISNQLRDIRNCLDISFADNACNLGDVETKHAGPLGILPHFTTDGVFGIAFLGRKERKDCTSQALKSLA